LTKEKNVVITNLENIFCVGTAAKQNLTECLFYLDIRLNFFSFFTRLDFLTVLE